MDVNISGDQALQMLMVAMPAMIGWWIKSSLDKLDQIKLINHKVMTLSEQLREIKGELRVIIEMGKSMAVLDNKANTLFKRYDELHERLNKISVQIQ